MNLFKKALAVVLCLSFLTTIPFCTNISAAYSPANGEFVFSNADLLNYLSEPYSVDAIYDSAENALKLTVNNDHNGSDPRVLLDLSSLSLEASSYKSLLVIYRVPTNSSSKATTTELFISAGSVEGPTAGKSVMYNITKSPTFTSQIVDLSALDWWNGSIHSVRIDPFTNASVGDTMYIDSVMLCSDYDSAISKRDTRMAEIYNVSTPDYSGSDYICTKYQYDKYTSPIWKGNIVYNEAVYPIKDKSGNAVYTLMYTPDEITSVYSADFSSKYYEGIDYTVSGNQIIFLTSGSINFKDYYYIHPQSNPYGYTWDRYYNRTAAGDGKWEYWGQSPEFFNGYINVSYTHSDTWDHFVPEQKSGEIPRTANVIKNSGSMNVVFFGDSICGGANSSSYRDVYPYAEYWNEMIVSKLRKDYGCDINVTYSAEGGGAAPDLVSVTDKWVTSYDPDLVFIEFGANDAMNWSQNSSGSASKLKSEFKGAVIDIINEVRNDLPNCEFVLVAPFYCNPHCHYMSYFEACRDALNEISASYSGVTVADITSMHASLLEFKDYLDFSGDNMCHPNDFMARIYAQVCLEAIVPGGIDAYTVNGEPPVVEPDVGNATIAAPGGYGWQWPSNEAYGYIGNYGGNGQDIVFTTDLSLISSAADEAKAIFYVDSGESIEITPTSVSVGGRSFSYDWGVADISNWHTVTIKIKNGAASVTIDGELVGSSSSGTVANTKHQLFFSYTGCMAIDNMSMKSSTGTTYFDCDFEDANEAQTLMSEGLGTRTLLAANTVSYDLNGGTGNIPNQIKVRNSDLTLTDTVPTKEGYSFLGWATSKTAEAATYESSGIYSTDVSVTLYAVWKSETDPDPEPTYPVITGITPGSCRINDMGTGTYKIYAEGYGLTYSWSCSDERLNPYLDGADTSVLTVSIDKLLSESLDATLTCTVTNAEGNSTTSSPVSFTYVLSPAPTVSINAPASASINDTGSASFSVSAEGSGLTYSWTCSDSALLPYISGANTDTLTITISEKLTEEVTATFICTVTDKNGRTATSEEAMLSYSLTPESTPEYILGDANGDGEIKATDSLLAKRIAAGIDTPTALQEKSLDVNSDGAINAADTNLISRYIAGIILEF